MSRPRAIRALSIAALCLAVAAPLPALARQPALERSGDALPELKPSRGVPAASDRVIVEYKRGTNAARRDLVRGAERLDRIGGIYGSSAEVVRPRGRSAHAAVAALRKRPDVFRATVDHRRVAAVEPTGEQFWASQWGHHNSAQTIQGTTGIADVDVDGLEALRFTGGSSSVVVAVIDDGVDFSHPDLSGRAWKNPGESGSGRETNGIDDDGNGFKDDVNGWDFCHNDKTVHDLNEDSHGTAVAGTMAASLNGTGSVGMAPSTRIMALKFLGPNCGFDSQAIAAINYAKSFGVRIINASWGGPGANASLESAIEGSGALFVAAAGNGGDDGIGDNNDVSPDYPSAFDSPNIISVGAIHNRGSLTTFSNYGKTTVDLVAPGQNVVAPAPATSSQGAGWVWASGTSFSAPYVSGVAALVGSAQPSLLSSPAKLRSRILSSTTPLASTAGKTATGGLLNARSALRIRPARATTSRIGPFGGSSLR